MKHLSLLLVIQVVVVVSTVVVALFKLSNLPPQIPLFYSQTSASGRVVDSYMLLIVPLMCVFIILFNRFILMPLSATNHLVLTIISVVNGSVVILCALICMKILLLVT